MKRLFCFFIMTAFLMGNCLPVSADGIGDNQCSEYLGVRDYREHDVSLSLSHQKPSARFSLQIKDSAGSLRSETISSGGTHLPNNTISSSQDSPVINAAVGESITINNHSSPGSGTTINQYDIQYRFVPEGSSREDCQIHSQIVSSFNSVKNIIENLSLEQEGTYEIFMAVADNASCLPGAVNWSANGNLRSINTSNPNFPNGMFWYFTEAVVIVGGQPPDFFPTPEGSSEWQESYKDPDTCAKTYIYQEGDTEITFPVTLRNSGEKATTDFRAVWYGQGNDPTKGWYGSNPPWKADLIELDQGGEQTFFVTIPLPVVGGDKLLAFKANIDGQTPANEVNQENNLMLIRIQREGIDIKALLPEVPIYYHINTGESVNVNLTLFTTYGEGQYMIPIPVTTTYSWPFGQETREGALSLQDSNLPYNINFTLNQPGTYKVYGESWPIGMTDIKPSNNKTEATIIVKEKRQSPAKKENPDAQTRVNLRS